MEQMVSVAFHSKLLTLSWPAKPEVLDLNQSGAQLSEIGCGQCDPITETLMAITIAEIELAAVGISVAAGCKACASYHIKAARKAQVSDDAIHQAVVQALYIRKVATTVMERHAFFRLGRIKGVASGPDPAELDRITVLVSLGAAFGVNCVTSFEKYLGVAEELGIPKQDADAIIQLAVMVKERAVSHVERINCTMEKAEN